MSSNIYNSEDTNVAPIYVEPSFTEIWRYEKGAEQAIKRREAKERFRAFTNPEPKKKGRR